jgi:hypothetical protein
VYFDRGGNVLEITGDVYEEIPLITGVTMEQPELYKKLPVNSTTLRNTMLSIAELMLDSKLNPDEISFDEQSNIFINIGTVVVALGQDEYLEEKIANLVQLYPEISSQSGILNMEGFTGKNEAITFRDSADIAAAEAESETEESSELSDEDDNLDPVSPGPDETTQDQDDNQSQTADDTKEEEVNSTVFMVFDSGGNLRYDARVSNGTVVDSYGNPIDGCYLNEAGNVVDAYWNEIDPATGQVLNLQ